MSHGGCSAFEVFLGVLGGAILLLLAFFGIIFKFLIHILGYGAAIFINGAVGVLGLIALILFAICLFKRLWRCCFGRKC